MDTLFYHSIWTVIAFITFVGIVVWAWSGARKQAFDEASRLPLEDDEFEPTVTTGEKNNG